MSKKNFPGVFRYAVTAGTTAVAVALLTAGFAQPSGASPRPVPMIGRNVKNTEFAGYTTTPKNGFASVSTTFTVPSLQNNCTKSKFNQVYEQFGVSDINTETSHPLQAGLEEGCASGVAVYDYVAITAAGTVVEPATPGDTVVTSMFQTGNWSEAEVHDLTNGQYWVSTYSASSNATEVSIGVVDGNGIAIPFATTAMSMDQVNGDYLGFDSPTADNLVNVQGHTLITSGALGSNGTSFNLVYKRSS